MPAPDLLLPFPFQLFVVIVLGLALGSFATALAYRVPRGIGWGAFEKTRSQCPECGRILRAIELVPLLSWMAQGGKCRGCKASIPAVYPLTELACLLMALGIFFVYGFTFTGFAILSAVPFLAALLAVDLERMILPNALVAALAVTGLFYHGAMALEGRAEILVILTHYLPAALVYGFALWALGWFMARVLKRDALGFGDVKFFAAAGFWLGFSALSALCLMAGGLGVALGLIWRLVFKSDVFPFGPALILAFYLCLLLQGASVI